MHRMEQHMKIRTYVLWTTSLLIALAFGWAGFGEGFVISAALRWWWARL
jgi:hypothetical protein